MSTLYPHPPDLPPPAMGVPPVQRPQAQRAGVSVLKKIGYFIGGTFWVVVNGSPMIPVGLVVLLAVLSEKRKLVPAVLVLVGCAIGAVGTGISFRYYTEGPSVGIHFNIGLHPKFNDMLLQRKVRASGVLDEGRAVADAALEAMKAGDAEAFSGCCDPRAFKGTDEIEGFFRTFREKLGTIESFEQAGAGMTWLPEWKKMIYVLFYDVETSKEGRVRVCIGLDKTSGGWKLVNINV